MKGRSHRGGYGPNQEIIYNYFSAHYYIVKGPTKHGSENRKEVFIKKKRGSYYPTLNYIKDIKNVLFTLFFTTFI